MGTSREQNPNKVNVFYSDAERLAALVDVHRRMLEDETTVPLIRATYEAAISLCGIIQAAKQSTESPRLQVLNLELDEAQRGALILARNFTRKETLKSGIDSVALTS